MNPRVGALLGLIALSVMTMGASGVRQFDGNHIHVFKISSGADTAFVSSDFDFNGDGNVDWSRVVGIGIKNGTAADDSLGYHTGKFLHKMAYPKGSADSWALDMKDLRTILGSSAQPDTVIWYQANSGVTWLYLFGE